MKTLTDTKQLGQMIRAARKSQGLTQEQLAATCGTGIRFIRELEHGKESCQIGKAMMVVKMLGMEILIDKPDLNAILASMME